MAIRKGSTSVGRRAAFKAAIALAGTTQTDFAAKQGVTIDHLILVLRGKRESPRLIGEIDAFIAKHLPAAQSPAA